MKGSAGHDGEREAALAGFIKVAVGNKGLWLDASLAVPFARSLIEIMDPAGWTVGPVTPPAPSREPGLLTPDETLDLIRRGLADGFVLDRIAGTVPIFRRAALDRADEGADGLAELRALSEVATPGPWKHYRHTLSHTNEVQAKRGKKPPIAAWMGFDDSARREPDHAANAAFIVAAVNYVRSLTTPTAATPAEEEG